MCGRYTQKESLEKLFKRLGLAKSLTLKPRYNIAPSQMVACVRHAPETGHREAVMLQWGLIPSWAKEAKSGYKMINARAETVAEKPSFRKAFKRQRCLVLADGFYEWKREGNTKQPYYIRFKDSQPFSFAGLWEHWQDTTKEDGEPIESCTIMTTGANELMEPIHHRMPVILDETGSEVWLNTEITEPTILNPLLRPQDSNEMEAYPVSLMVNNPRNDRPECVEAI